MNEFVQLTFNNKKKDFFYCLATQTKPGQWALEPSHKNVLILFIQGIMGWLTFLTYRIMKYTSGLRGYNPPINAYVGPPTAGCRPACAHLTWFITIYLPEHLWLEVFCLLLVQTRGDCSHRRRIKTEEKAKVVAVVWGTYTWMPHKPFSRKDDLNKSLWKNIHSGIHPFLQIILVINL